MPVHWGESLSSVLTAASRHVFHPGQVFLSSHLNSKIVFLFLLIAKQGDWIPKEREPSKAAERELEWRFPDINPRLWFHVVLYLHWLLAISSDWRWCCSWLNDSQGGDTQHCHWQTDKLNHGSGESLAQPRVWRTQKSMSRTLLVRWEKWKKFLPLICAYSPQAKTMRKGQWNWLWFLSFYLNTWNMDFAIENADTH